MQGHQHNIHRPRFLNLFKIRLPVTGIISIFHRMTGAILFLVIPFSLYLLHRSVVDGSSHREVLDLMLMPVARFFILMVIWSFVHHLVTGIRYLLIDMEFFLQRKSSRISAWAVVVIEAIIMALIIVEFFL